MGIYITINCHTKAKIWWDFLLIPEDGLKYHCRINYHQNSHIQSQFFDSLETHHESIKLNDYRDFSEKSSDFFGFKKYIAVTSIASNIKIVCKSISHYY